MHVLPYLRELGAKGQVSELWRRIGRSPSQASRKAGEVPGINGARVQASGLRECRLTARCRTTRLERRALEREPWGAEIVLILLIGPKGSGKSHIGRALEARHGVHFFHVEPLWLEYYEECNAANREPVIAEGIAKVHPALIRALDKHVHVCVETTGAWPEILAALLSLRPRNETLVARVSAPLEVCLRRVSSRDQTYQIPVELETVRKVHRLSESLQLRYDITLDNVALTEHEIAELFESALAVRGAGPAQARVARSRGPVN
jgi:shikimate kinase